MDVKKRILLLTIVATTLIEVRGILRIFQFNIMVVYLPYSVIAS